MIVTIHVNYQHLYNINTNECFVKSKESKLLNFFSGILKTRLGNSLSFSGFFLEISESPFSSLLAPPKNTYFKGGNGGWDGGREESFKGGLPLFH